MYKTMCKASQAYLNATSGLTFSNFRREEGVDFINISVYLL